MVKFKKKFLKNYLPIFLKENEKKRENVDDDDGDNKRANLIVFCGHLWQSPILIRMLGIVELVIPSNRAVKATRIYW